MFSIITAASWRPPSAQRVEFAEATIDQTREKDYILKDYMVSSTSTNNMDSFNNTSPDKRDGETSGNDKHGEQGVEVIEFVTDNQYDIDTLGLRLSGNRSVGVFVTSISTGSIAEQSQKIFSGDQLLNIDNVALAGLTPDQVVRVLRSNLAAKGRVTITVAHAWAERMCMLPSTSRRYAAPPPPKVIQTSVIVHQASTSKPEQEVEKSTEEPKHPHTVNTDTVTNSTMVPLVGNGPSFRSRSSLKKHDAENQRTKSSKSKVAPLTIKYPSKEAMSSDGSMLPSPDSKEPSKDKLSPNQNSSSSRRQSKSMRSVSADSSPGIASALIDSDTNDRADGGSSSIGSYTPDAEMDGRRSSITIMTRAVSARSEENSLNVPMNTRIGTFMNTMGQRKSLAKNLSNDELPLVSFDQLTQSSSSSSGEKRHDRNDSSHSKSSKGSTRSNKSQELSWHCPVCLDGASRVDRTQRKMMSTVCGHVFCSKCVEDVIYKYKMCPTCRMSLSATGEVHPIFMI